MTRRHEPKDLNAHVQNSDNFMSFIIHIYIYTSLTQVNELNFWTIKNFPVKWWLDEYDILFNS